MSWIEIGIGLYLLAGVLLVWAAVSRQPRHKKLAMRRNRWQPLTNLFGVLLWPLALITSIISLAKRD